MSRKKKRNSKESTINNDKIHRSIRFYKRKRRYRDGRKSKS